MRLSEFERKTIKHAAREVWGDMAMVYLFGSRTDDTKRGGDIDLFIQLEKEPAPKEVMLQKAQFLSKLDILLGEQKIDLLVSTRYNNHLPIVKTARLKGIAL
ncbi:MAG: nucleotidyltransferase domain-containing protein [Mangrovibacterium sp.]